MCVSLIITAHFCLLELSASIDTQVDCSQSPISREIDHRRSRSLSPTGRHLGLLTRAKLGRMQKVNR